MRLSPTLALFTILLATAAACGGADSAPAASATADAGTGAATEEAGTTPDSATGDGDAGAPGPVEIRDGHGIFVDGAPFVARGLIAEGLLLPLRDVEQCLRDYPTDDPGGIHKYCARHVDARSYLHGTEAFAGNDMLSLAIANWKINAIRFNVLQVALDPASPYYSADYLREIVEAVTLARARGLVVFVAIFDSPANDDAYFKDRYPKLSLDDAVTEAAAKTLAGAFGQDPKVFLELLNEPYLAKTAPDVRWRIWRDGGSVDYGPFAGHAFVGVNRIIQTIRATGAKNPVVVQPPSATFVGFPGGVVDPLGLVVYASHPFLTTGDDDDVNWHLHFGELARSLPYVQTAWNVNSEDPWCATRGATMAQKYVDYLGREGLGVFGFALDVNGSVVVSFQGKLDKPSKIGAGCTAGGGGELLQASFAGTRTDLGDLPPVLGGITAPATGAVGQTLAVTVAASDADGDPLDYQIAWGDGAVSPAAGAVQTASAFTHAYAAPGAYAVRVRVVDARGAEVAGSASITIGN